MSDIERMFYELDNQILSEIRRLLIVGTEWRRREIEFLAGVVQRMASRADSAVQELDFEVQRIWTNKVVARRWGRTLPRMDRPMITLQWPGKADPSYYNEVVMYRSPYGDYYRTTIPAMPYADILHTDPRWRWVDTDLILGQIQGVRVVAKRKLDIDYIYGAGCSATVLDFSGRTSIMARPITWMVRRFWSDPACIVGPSTDICFKPGEVTMTEGGYEYVIEVDEVKSWAMSLMKVYARVDGSDTWFEIFLGVANARAKITMRYQNYNWYTKDDQVTAICAYTTIPFDTEACEVVLRDTAIPLMPVIQYDGFAYYNSCIVIYKQGARRAVLQAKSVQSS